VLLTVLTMGIMTGAFALAGSHYLVGLATTTTNRAQGADRPLDLLGMSLQAGGPMWAVALLGGAAYIWRERMGEIPGQQLPPAPGRRWRACLGVLLCGSATLAPAYQMHLHTSVSLHKHIGFGLFFAAPMAGVGLTRLVGRHFRNPQTGIALWIVLLVLGMTQARDRYAAWPDSTSLVTVLRSQLKPGAHYLVEANWVPQYYLREQTTPTQWASTYFMDYTDHAGRNLSGVDAYRSAIVDGYFQIIVLSRTSTVALDDTLIQQLRASTQYRLLGKLPYRHSEGPALYRSTYGTGYFEIWAKVRSI
jgi:hypothetical protein